MPPTPAAAGRAGSPSPGPDPRRPCRADRAVMTARMELVPAVPIRSDRRHQHPDRPAASAAVRPESAAADPSSPITQASFIDRTEQSSTWTRRSPRQPSTPGRPSTISPTVIGTDDLVHADPTRQSRAGPDGGALRHARQRAEAALSAIDKRRAEEEATLRLRLTIDARGRVIAVEPVGPADPSFLEAARRHILRAWRYKPATEDGVAVRRRP